MIDIHTHILPGIDDGARNMEDALDMARAASEDGITDLIATPHYGNGAYMNRAVNILEATMELNDRLVKEGIPLTVHAGQEIRVHDELLDAWARGELLCLAGTSYILIEMPGHSVPKSMNDVIHELTIMGLKPVIAHPERNLDIIRSPELLSELLDSGAYAQITSHSLLGSFGANAQKCAWTLCRKGWAHLISSDAHNVTKRGFRLQEAYDQLRGQFNAKAVDYYQSNAQSLIKDLRLQENDGEKQKVWIKYFNMFLK